jgi:outer membrane receptor for ferrienterochelin and colicin
VDFILHAVKYNPMSITQHFNKNGFSSKLLHLIIMLVLAFSGSSYAQSVSIKGVISESGTGVPLPGASIVVEGTTTGGISDINGNYEIKGVAPGTVKIRISYIGYTTLLIDNVVVKPGTSTVLNGVLKQDVNLLNTAEVYAVKKTHTDNAVLMEMKQSDQVMNGISAQQISRSQDRTAGEVMRRIPGVTLLDNGYVNIRGLSERYNLTLLNNVPAPGMEADKRAFSLDVIPSSMLDRLLVFKTASPELPGYFAGGLIKAVLKSDVDENQIRVSYTAGYRSNTTFEDFYQAPKGASDWLGTDDGTRKLPGDFPDNLYDIKSSQLLAELGKQLPNAWTPAKITASPDHRFSTTLMNSFKIGKLRASQITAIQYGMTYDSQSASNYNFNAYDFESQTSDTIYAYQDRMFRENIRISLIHNWTFLFKSGWKMEFRNFLNQQGSNQAIIRDGNNYEEGSMVRSYAFRYQERTVYSGQLSGSHDLFSGRSYFRWNAGYSYAHSAEPDFRRVRTKKDLGATSDSIPYQVIIAPSASTIDAGRFYSDLYDHSGTLLLDYEQKLGKREEALQTKLKIGVHGLTRMRTFDARWMSYKQSRLGSFNNELLYLPLEQIFAPENINDSTGFKLEEGTNPSDSYSASESLIAGYAALVMPLSKTLNISGGIRYEFNSQILESRTYTNKPVSVNSPVHSLLPSINTTCNFNENSLVRLAYGKTLNRPEFRELAPFAYYDFSFNNVLTGNPDLKTSSIHNIDLRWENYPAAGELFSLGVFYKHFIDPIEMFFVPGSGSGGTRNFTFGNAESATSIGAELEVKKHFVSRKRELQPDAGLFGKLLQMSGATFNCAYIHSRVKLGDKVVGQESERPMMGQSPYMINAGLFISDLNSRWQFSALYNIIGKRIYAVGTYGTPDIYFMPRPGIDLNFSTLVGERIELKAGVADLLARDEIYQQDSDENGEINNTDNKVLVVRKGAYYTLSLNVKF